MLSRHWAQNLRCELSASEREVAFIAENQTNIFYSDESTFIFPSKCADTTNADNTKQAVSSHMTWLAKCCNIQQLIFMFNEIYLYSTFYIYIQQYAFSFNFNPNYFHSTKIIIQLQPTLFSFNKNSYSTSTKIILIQQKCLFNFNQK